MYDLKLKQISAVYRIEWGFPGGSDSKESACNIGDGGSIAGLGRSLGDWNGYPLLYSCLEKSMDRGDRQIKVHRVQSLTLLRDYHFHFFIE